MAQKRATPTKTAAKKAPAKKAPAKKAPAKKAPARKAPAPRKASAAKNPITPKKGATGVSKVVKVAGRRIGSVQAANQARQQKRRDSR